MRYLVMYSFIPQPLELVVILKVNTILFFFFLNNSDDSLRLLLDLFYDTILQVAKQLKILSFRSSLDLV